VYTPLGPTLNARRPWPSGFLFLGPPSRIGRCQQLFGGAVPALLARQRRRQEGRQTPWSCGGLAGNPPYWNRFFLKPASAGGRLCCGRFWSRSLTAAAFAAGGFKGGASPCWSAHWQGSQPCWARLPPWTSSWPWLRNPLLACEASALPRHSPLRKGSDRDRIFLVGLLDLTRRQDHKNNEESRGGRRKGGRKRRRGGFRKVLFTQRRHQGWGRQSVETLPVLNR